MKQFVPVDDDALFAPDVRLETLVPYRCGLPCRHALQEPPDDAGAARAMLSDGSPRNRPA